MKILRTLAVALAAAAGLAHVGGVQATTIPLINPSFEAPVVGAWTSGFFPEGWTWEYGTFIQSPAAHDGNQGVVNLGSKNAFFRLSQNSDYAIRGANETITGQVWVRVSNLERGLANFELVLLLGGVPVSTNLYSVDTSMVTGQTLDWKRISVQYVSKAEDVGQFVGVAVGSDGGDNSAGYSPSYCYLDEVSLDTVSVGGPTAEGTATPSSAELFASVFFSVKVTPGTDSSIQSVVLDGSALGADSAIPLIAAGNNVYTNSVPAVAPTALDVPLVIPATVTDGSGLVGQAKISVTINRPSLLTWAGGNGNWNDLNWLPNNLSGPVSGVRTAVVTNGVVVVDQPGGVGGISSIVLAPTGTLQVHNGKYGSYGNILFAGGTLDTFDASAYHAYGASILSSVQVAAGVNSSIQNSAGSWYNLSDPASTFTVQERATLSISALLAGAVASNDQLYNPSGLIKAGPGTLVLSGDNTYEGETAVKAGKLSLASGGALKTSSKLSVDAGAVVDLNYAGSIELSELHLGGVKQAFGTHGATGSGAAHINDTYFTGTGMITVTPPLILSYAHVGGGQIQLTWDGNSTLQMLVNAVSADQGNDWVDLPDISPATITVDPANTSTLFRLRP